MVVVERGVGRWGGLLGLRWWLWLWLWLWWGGEGGEREDGEDVDEEWRAGYQRVWGWGVVSCVVSLS